MISIMLMQWFYICKRIIKPHDQPLAYRKQGLVGRVSYMYDDRYSIEGNFGYTGSETFAKGHRFGLFPQ